MSIPVGATLNDAGATRAAQREPVAGEGLPPESPGPDPDQTPSLAVQTEGETGACGARLRGRHGEFCAEPPVQGRRRCRLHGGATPVGRESPHFLSGRHARHPVPLTAAEQARYEQYTTAVYDPARPDLIGDLALARIQYERAVTAGSSGVAEAAVVARLAAVQGRLATGRVRPELNLAAEDAIWSIATGVVEQALREELGAGSEHARFILWRISALTRDTDWSAVNTARDWNFARGTPRGGWGLVAELMIARLKDEAAEARAAETRAASGTR
jgi:hypothetical protein